MKEQQGTDKDLTVKLKDGELKIINEMAKSVIYSKASYTIEELKAMFETTPEPTEKPYPTVKPVELTRPTEIGSMAWLWITLAVMAVGAVTGVVVAKKKIKK